VLHIYDLLCHPLLPRSVFLLRATLKVVQLAEQFVVPFEDKKSGVQ